MLSLGPSPVTSPQIVLVSTDLFFGSQVTSTANGLGIPAALAMSLPALDDHLAGGTVRGVMLDLAGTISPRDIMVRLTQLDPSIRPRTVAFGPHVNTEALQAASTAGFDDVMPRSRFSATLPQLLRSLVAPLGTADQ